MREYAIYDKYENLIGIGTIKQLSRQTGIKEMALYRKLSFQIRGRKSKKYHIVEIAE